MKTTLKISLAALIAATAIISSCGKYEEGPKISLASKKGRVVNNWKLSEYLINGSSQNLGGVSYLMDVKKDGSYTVTTSFGNGDGKWAFSSDKTQLITTPTGSNTATTATILRLKSNEMWTKEVDNGTTYESHYVSN